MAARRPFGGAAPGVVLALSQRLRLPDLRFLILGIAAVLLAVHAGFAGVNDAPRPPELTYVPRTEIQYLTFARHAR